ncbi:hypothetical protein Tco_1258325, partial [Tanacetum coccineum]
FSGPLEPLASFTQVSLLLNWLAPYALETVPSFSMVSRTVLSYRMSHTKTVRGHHETDVSMRVVSRPHAKDSSHSYVGIHGLILDVHKLEVDMYQLLKFIPRIMDPKDSSHSYVGIHGLILDVHKLEVDMYQLLKFIPSNFMI